MRFGNMAKKMHLVAYLKAGPSASPDDLFRPER